MALSGRSRSWPCLADLDHEVCSRNRLSIRGVNPFNGIYLRFTLDSQNLDLFEEALRLPPVSIQIDW